MELGEDIYLTPEKFVENFGVELATRGWTVNEATTQLSVVLTAVYADAKLVSGGITELATREPDKILNPAMSEFSQIIKLMTRGMLYRDDPDTEPLLDRQPQLPPDTNGQAMANSTEGVIWIDPQAELWRNKMTTQTAKLLMAFRRGLAQGGYPESKSKAIMRQDIDEALDYLVTKTSYAAGAMVPVLVAIMSKAELNNFKSPLRWVRRFGLMIRTARGQLTDEEKAKYKLDY